MVFLPPITADLVNDLQPPFGSFPSAQLYIEPSPPAMYPDWAQAGLGVVVQLGLDLDELIGVSIAVHNALVRSDVRIHFEQRDLPVYALSADTAVSTINDVVVPQLVAAGVPPHLFLSSKNDLSAGGTQLPGACQLSLKKALAFSYIASAFRAQRADGDGLHALLPARGLDARNLRSAAAKPWLPVPILLVSHMSR